ncbi:hypothetical protein [Hyphomonas sp.]|uniref:hypothetical protein n=1 Tax=Hyphomonas sp. TaxID=87 RepID=UPI0039194B8D
MSEETKTPERDSSGRFIRRAAERVNALSRTGPGGEHPMGRIFFGWTESKAAGALVFWAVAAIAVLLVLLDLVIVRPERIALAGAAGFYALWGFGAFTAICLAAWPLGRLLRRDDNYYGEASGPPADIDPAIAEDKGAGKPGPDEGGA